MGVNVQYMSYKIDFSVATSDQIEAALCKRLENIRRPGPPYKSL